MPLNAIRQQPNFGTSVIFMFVLIFFYTVHAGIYMLYYKYIYIYIIYIWYMCVCARLYFHVYMLMKTTALQPVTELSRGPLLLTGHADQSGKRDLEPKTGSIQRGNPATHHILKSWSYLFVFFLPLILPLFLSFFLSFLSFLSFFLSFVLLFFLSFFLYFFLSFFLSFFFPPRICRFIFFDLLFFLIRF